MLNVERRCAIWRRNLNLQADAIALGSRPSLRGPAVLLGFFVALLVLLAIPTSSAVAKDCPSEQTLLPADGDPPFQCAQMEHSDKKSLNPGQTKTWTKTIESGYDIKYHCEKANHPDVTTSYAYSNGSGDNGFIPSYTASGTNWGTGDHSFAAGVIFATNSDKVKSSGYDKDCNKQGQIKNSIVRKMNYAKLISGYESGTQSQTMEIIGYVDPSSAVGPCVFTYDYSTNPPTVTGLASGCLLLYVDNTDPQLGQPFNAYGALNNGTATIKWTPPDAGTHTLTVLYNGDTMACPSYEDTCGYAPAEPKTYTTEIAPASSTARSAAASVPPESSGVSVPSALAHRDTSAGADHSHSPFITRTKSARMPARLALSCPKGDVLMYAETLSPGEAPLVYSLHGVRVRSGDVRRGRRVTVQITCRARSARLSLHSRLGLGTPHRDTIATGKDSGSMAFAGPGNDLIRVRSRSALGNGGLGADRIVVAARDAVANGGPGADRLIAKTRKRALLYGGPGRDTLVGSKGATLINAKDGERDLVVCGSRRNRVIVDRRDAVRGPC